MESSKKRLKLDDDDGTAVETSGPILKFFHKRLRKRDDDDGSTQTGVTSKIEAVRGLPHEKDEWRVHDGSLLVFTKNGLRSSNKVRHDANGKCHIFYFCRSLHLIWTVL